MSVGQLLLRDISHHTAQLHVSAQFYGANFGLLIYLYNTFLEARPEDGCIEMSRKM